MADGPMVEVPVAAAAAMPLEAGAEAVPLEEADPWQREGVRGSRREQKSVPASPHARRVWMRYWKWLRSFTIWYVHTVT